MNIVSIVAKTNTCELFDIPVSDLSKYTGTLSIGDGYLPKLSAGKFVASSVIEDKNGQIFFKNYKNDKSYIGTPVALLGYDINGGIIPVPLVNRSQPVNTVTTSQSFVFNGTPLTIPIFSSDGSGLEDSDFKKFANGNYSLGGTNPFFKFDVDKGSINIAQQTTNDAFRINNKIVITVDQSNDEITIGNTIYHTANIQHIKTDSIQFNTSATGVTGGVGVLTWNDTDGTLEFGMKGGNVTQQIGQELPVLVKHADNSGLTNGSVVYIVGSDGNHKTVRLAKADSEATSSNTFGIMTESATGGDKAFCTTFGLVRDINTSSLTEGSAVYLSPSVAGGITSTKPIAPNHTVLIGFCVRSHSTNGSIFVNINNGYELDELHDVLIDTKTNKDLLSYESVSGLWKNKTFADLGLATVDAFWSISGNNIATTGIIGSTTAQDVVFKANNQNRFTMYANAGLAIHSDIVFEDIVTLESSVNISALTASQILALDASKNIQSLSTVTYPSLTELSYIKGLTSSAQTQINSKEPTITAGTISQYWRGDKSWQTLDKSAVGLGNVDNTTDLLKPISTATQAALDLKANLAGPTFTGTVVLPSTTSIGTVSSTEIGYLDGVTSGIQSQLYTKFTTPSGLTTNYVSKWNGTSYTNSQIFDNGRIGLNQNVPLLSLEVNNSSTSTYNRPSIGGRSNDGTRWTYFLAPVNSGTIVDFIRSSNTDFRIGTESLLGAGTFNNQFYITSSGSIGISSSSLTGYGFRNSRAITGATTAFGNFIDGQVQSNVTSAAIYNRTISQVASNASALPTLVYYQAMQGTFTGTVTDQYGFIVESSLIGATNNYGFRGKIPAATGRWNNYHDGTAQNWFAGNTGIGSGRSVPVTALDVNGQVSVSLGSASAPAYTFFGDLNNGWFSPTADTQAWSVGGVEVMRLSSGGSLGLGTTSLTGVSLMVSRNITGSTVGVGVGSYATVQSDVTGVAIGYDTWLGTQASTFTLGELRHYNTSQTALGAGSTINTQTGFHVASSLIGATTNYGFRGLIPSGTSRWNIFMDGTAQNYFRGNVGIGVGKTTPSVELDVAGTIATTNLKITSGASVGKYWVCTNADGTGAWTTVTDSYLGTWNANTNTPTITNGTGTTGQWYRVVVSGTWNSITFAVGDDVKYNGSVWEKIPGQGYTLQTATASVLGGIKVGTGLTIDSGTGVLSVSYGTTSTTVATGNHTHTFSSLTGIPTTVSGYGLTINTSDITGLSSYASFSAYTTTSALTTLLSGKSDTGHTHTFSEITSTPTTATGYGIVLVASDIPSLDWSKITTGKPTTLSGYGITDAQSVLNGTGYVKMSGTTLSYINKEFVDTTTDQTIYGQKIFRDSFKVGNSLFNIQTGQPDTVDNDLKFDFITDATSFNYSISDIDDNIGTLFSIQGNFTGTNIRTDISTDLYIYRIVDSNLSTGTNKQILRTDSSGILNWTTIDGSYISNWATKQDALNGTGFVKANGTTITYDNSTYLSTSVAATTYQPLDADLTSISALTGDGVLRKVSNVWNLDTDMYLTTDTKIYFIATATQVGLVNPGTTLTVNGLGNLNLKSGIVTTGTYRSVTVDTYGRVTAGTNPTTVVGYGLTDVWTKTESDARYLLQSSYNPTWGQLTGSPIDNTAFNSTMLGYVNTSTTQTGIAGSKTFTSAMYANGTLTTNQLFVKDTTGGNAYPLSIVNALTYNGWSGSSLIKSGLDIYNDYKPLVFLGSHFMMLRGSLKLGGNSVGATGTVDFATERLDITGNIRYSGTLKPSNIAPSVGQFLKAGSTTTNEWATLTTSDISGLSSYTGFTNYTTNDGLAALVDSIIPSGTSGHFLTRDSGGALTFMNIDIDPVMLSANKIAVGSPQGILTEVAGFEFVDKRYLSITRKGYADQKITIGHGTNSQHALFDVQGGRMELNSNIGIRFNNLAGADTRMMVVNASGDISTQAIPTGGSGSNYLPYRRVPYGSAENTQTSDDSLRFYSSVLESELKLGISTPLSFRSDNTGYNNYIQSIGGYINMSSNRISLLVSASGQPNSGEIELSSYHNTLIHSGYGDVIINATEGDVIIKGGAVEWVTTTINGQTRQILCKKL